MAGSASVAVPSAPVTAVAPPPLTVTPAAGVRVPLPTEPVASLRYSTAVTVKAWPRSATAGTPSSASGNTVGA